MFGMALSDYALSQQKPVFEVNALENPTSGGTGGSYTCSSGGPGSTSCSVSSNGVFGELFGGGTECSVTCSPGYYACCNAYHNKCQCRKG